MESRTDLERGFWYTAEYSSGYWIITVHGPDTLDSDWGAWTVLHFLKNVDETKIPPEGVHLEGSIT